MAAQFKKYILTVLIEIWYKEISFETQKFNFITKDEGSLIGKVNEI